MNSPAEAGDGLAGGEDQEEEQEEEEPFAGIALHSVLEHRSLPKLHNIC